MTYKKIVKKIFIPSILILVFVILHFYKSEKIIFDDFMILGLWNDNKVNSEYEITSQNIVEIDVFTTSNNKIYKKIAPGTRGSFIIKFKRPIDSMYKIMINEKTAKPRNLFFILDNKKYYSIKEMESVINDKFMDNEKISINWIWEYYINELQDIQDTKDGENAQNYLFEIKAIIGAERTEI